MVDHCKLWWRGGSQNPNRKVSSQPRICGGKAGSNQENLLLEEHEYFWSNTEIIIKYPTHSFNHLVRLHQPGCFPRARGEIELQCSVTGKMLAGYNRFDHNHIECKQSYLSKYLVLNFFNYMFLLSFSMRSHVIDTKCSFTVKTRPHRNN